MSRSGSSSRKAAATSLLGEIADAAPPDNSTVRRWIARIDALQAQVDREKKARLVAEQRLERARSSVPSFADATNSLAATAGRARQLGQSPPHSSQSPPAT
jgi:ATP/maltotriose-dependent transcriptional regulator MalT